MLVLPTCGACISFAMEVSLKITLLQYMLLFLSTENFQKIVVVVFSLSHTQFHGHILKKG